MFFETIKKHLQFARQAVQNQKKEPGPLKKNNIELEFLPSYLEILERPPSRNIRLFGMAIISICGIVLAWAILSNLDIIASATGRVVIAKYTKTIQAQDQGIVARIAIRDGDTVKKGDVLIELNPVASQADLKRITSQRMLSSLEVSRLEALLRENPSESFIPEESADREKVKLARDYLLSEYREYIDRKKVLESKLMENKSKYNAAHDSIQKTQAILNNVQQRYEMLRKLFEKGSESKARTLEIQHDLLELKRDLSQQNSSAVLLNIEERTLQNEIALHQSEWRRGVMLRLLDEQRKLSDLKQEQIKASEQSRRQTITAPESGIVQQLAVKTLGSVVKQGQDVLVIVPNHDAFLAEVNLLNKDVGFVRRGQKVEIKFDTFPYTKFGTMKAEVLNISQDAVEDEKLGLIYPAKLRLAEQSFIADGKTINLTAGMAVTAEINTGTRRVIDYVLSPIQAHMNEALRER